MSYTIPEYVDTREQAVLAVASAIKGEAVTGGDGSVNRALDILADVLAEQDVQVPQTNAGAILALAQYVTGGGGCSSDFTTAKVTYTTDSNGYELNGVFVDDGFLSTSWTTSGAEFTLVLYKGSGGFMCFDEPTITVVSGDAVVEDGMPIITGDCTLAFTAS